MDINKEFDILLQELKVCEFYLHYHNDPKEFLRVLSEQKLKMLNRCRFCGLSKRISTFRDITEDSTIQDNIKKYGIRMEENEFLP
jgi:hypothetical protein